MLFKKSKKRVKVPTVLQMEAVECGAASLAMILACYGRIVPLEKLRLDCGVSRDGSKASNVVKAARTYGFEAKGLRTEVEGLKDLSFPAILFWNFNHFLVLEGIRGGKAFLNDPASGPKVITLEELDDAFTGVVLTFEPNEEFQKGGEKHGILKSLKKRVQGYSIPLSYVVLTGLFLVIPGLIIPTFSRIFVDNILVGGMKSWILPLLMGMGATIILRGILIWLQEYYLLRIESKLALVNSAKFFRHIFHLPIEFFNQRMGGEIGHRVQLNDKIAQTLSGSLATNVLNLVLIVFYAFIMFQYDCLLTLVGIGIALLNMVALWYVSGKRVVLSQKIQQESGKLMGISMSGMQMIETMKASGTESDFFSQWSGQHAKVVNAEQEMGVSSQILSVIPGFLMTLNSTVILGLGGYRVMEGHLSMGMLVAFQSLMSSFMAPVNQLVGLGSELQETKADMTRIDDVMKYEQDEAFKEKSPSTQLEKAKFDGYLELKNLTFGYSRLEPPLIEDFSLSLNPGMRIALVGESGSGKSTVAKLVAGLYPFWSGDITFDDRPARHYDRHIIHNSLAMVDQDIFMFEGTIRENMTMWDTTVPDNDVQQAAMDACIHNDIAARTGGYSSQVDEGGANFSGGQLQRLEIARALVNNPTILIMDEATSALDANTEKQVDSNLRRRGCTCLIIAHRLSTIRDCDEIIVLDHGRVVQRGTHKEMMKTPGAYTDLIKSY